MTPVKEMLLAVSSSLAASLVAKVTVITALALFAVWLARGRRAAVRHAFLAAAFGGTLLLPIASVLVAPVRLAVPMVVENRVSAAAASLRGAEIIPPIPATDAPDVRVMQVPQSPQISLANLLLTVWIAGVAIFLLPLVIGLWQIRLLRGSGLPWLHGQSLAETIARDAGIYRRVEVLLHEEVPGPMTCGIVHPTIVLPSDAESWNEEDLSRAFVHELEHVRRGDSVSSFLARGACAVYWFHPLVWIAWRRLALEAERSCDDAVLGRSDPTAYAEQLVGLAKRLVTGQRSPLLAMANRADLTTRVRAVLDVRQRRGRAGMLWLALAYTGAALLVVTISPLTLVAAPQAQTRPEFEVASVKQLENRRGEGPDLSFVGTAGNPFKISGNRIILNGTLHAFIAAAYSVKDYQVSGVPSWADSLMFNITAQSASPDGATQDRARVMLQSLLADRFQVKLHRDSKVMPVYYLIQSKSSKMFTPAGADETFSWKVTQEAGGLMRSKATKESIGDFVQLVGASADRPVIDKTGITGFIDYDLLYEPPRSAGSSVGEGGGGGKTAPNPDDLNRTLIEAIQDQLGLKLQAAKDPVEILVIDHAERPSEN